MSNTTFPNATQSFKIWEDLTQAQLNAYVQYINYLNQGNWTAARDVFEQGRLSSNMLPTAADFNAMCDTILECQALYEAPTTSAQGIQDFMGQFAYHGNWDVNNINQYKKFTLITYGSYLYIANQDITTTVNPADNSAGSATNKQWLQIVPAQPTTSTTSFVGQYSTSSVPYYSGQVVIYNNVFYVATRDNVSTPPPDTSSWAALFNMNPYMTRVSTSRPAYIVDGVVWLKPTT